MEATSKAERVCFQRRAYVIRMPTILPQAADAKRDKAKAGRFGA